jgi:hypothetical protein
MRPHRDDDEQRSAPRRLPPLLRYLGLHLVLGCAIGVCFVSLLVLLNIAGLHDLMSEAEDPVLPMIMLYVFNMLTFSSVTMGAAIMLLKD